MTQHLADRDKARMSRLGLAPLSTEQALHLFDDAMLTDRPMMVAARIDSAALADQRAALPPAAEPVGHHPTHPAHHRRNRHHGSLDDEASSDGCTA